MIVILIILILTSACFSGLTIGMFSISLSSLERKIKLGNTDAEKIYRIRKNGNYLLSTLLLGNVAVNSAISLVMGGLSSGFMAGNPMGAMIGDMLNTSDESDTNNTSITDSTHISSNENFS